MKTSRCILNVIFGVIFFIRDVRGQESSPANQFLPENGRLTFLELAEKYGLAAEEHNVTTEDGYILRVFHIPGKKAEKPLIVLHGILDSSDTWIIRGNLSLAVTFSLLGYDLWFPNVRGNRYSRRHVRLDPDLDDEYWNFSFHEYGYYDLAAIIDLVLNKTGADKLSAFAHSQGNTMFYVLTSTRPEYNSKINLMVALAPISYLQNVKPPLSTLITFSPFIYRTFIALGGREIFGETSTENTLLKLFCPLPIIGYLVCVEGFVFSITGKDPEQLEASFTRVVIGHFPSGTSIKNLYHFGQVGMRKKFAQFDYGLRKNLMKYKSAKPPEYDLKKVTIKIALFVAKNDKLSTLADVAILRDQLPNVVQYNVNEYNEYNHIDYLWARGNKEFLYPQLQKVLDANL